MSEPHPIPNDACPPEIGVQLNGDAIRCPKGLNLLQLLEMLN